MTSKSMKWLGTLLGCLSLVAVVSTIAAIGTAAGPASVTGPAAAAPVAAGKPALATSCAFGTFDLPRCLLQASAHVWIAPICCGLIIDSIPSLLYPPTSGTITASSADDSSGTDPRICRLLCYWGRDMALPPSPSMTPLCAGRRLLPPITAS